jgi:hypothetical protein
MPNSTRKLRVSPHAAQCNPVARGDAEVPSPVGPTQSPDDGETSVGIVRNFMCVSLWTRNFEKLGAAIPRPEKATHGASLQVGERGWYVSCYI